MRFKLALAAPPARMTRALQSQTGEGVAEFLPLHPTRRRIGTGVRWFGCRQRGW